MAIIDLNLATFGQTVELIKTGKDLLMSGELNLSNLTGTGTEIEAVITKGHKEDSSEKEGRPNTFKSKIKVRQSINLEQNDLIITQEEIFLVGEVSLRNDNITGTAGVLSGYKVASLELYT